MKSIDSTKINVFLFFKNSGNQQSVFPEQQPSESTARKLHLLIDHEIDQPLKQWSNNKTEEDARKADNHKPKKTCCIENYICMDNHFSRFCRQIYSSINQIVNDIEFNYSDRQTTYIYLRNSLYVTILLDIVIGNTIGRSNASKTITIYYRESNSQFYTNCIS